MAEKHVNLDLIVGCGGGRCPRIFKDINGDFIIQGFKVSDEIKKILDLSKTEGVVRLPEHVVSELIKNI